MNTQTATNFSDIFKSSFLEKTTSFSFTDAILGIIVSFLIGIFIYSVYKKTFSGVLYSHNFNISLIGMTMATSLIIMGVTTNVVLSLGMVGALSIVRFRTAIKDPMDTFYLFWSVACGILCGAGLLPLAIIGSILIGIVMIIFVNKISVENPFLLIVRYSEEGAEEEINGILNKSTQKYFVKLKAFNTLEDLEVTYEVRLRKNNTDFINDIGKLNGVESVSMLSYDGNFAS